MLRIIIAEDELLARVGIASLIDWEANGFQVVGQAANGPEALAIFERYGCDILISDILMPGLTGIELIQKLKEKAPFLQTIILTNYDNFKYAQKALNLGVNYYLLKSELNAVSLLSMLEELKKNHIQSSGAYMNSENQRMEMLFASICDGGDCSMYADLMGNAPWTIAFCRLQTKNERMNDEIFRLAEQFCSSTHALVWIHGEEIAFLFDKKEGVESSSGRAVRIASLIQRNVMQFFNCAIPFGFSEEGESVGELPRMYAHAEYAADLCFFNHKMIMNWETEIPVSNKNCPDVQYDLLYQLLAAGNEAEFLRRVDEIITELYDLCVLSFVRRCYRDFLACGLILARKFHLSLTGPLAEEKFSGNNFEQFADFEEFADYIHSLYHDICAACHREETHTYSYLVKRCIDEINKNYRTGVSLQGIAEQMNVSTGYLSLLFKQETGVNFTKYVNSHRIDIAKDLIRQNYKVYQVAEMVGFDNPYYFSRVFREMTGMSCREYRNSLL